MTDLERLWGDYPTSAAPVREILASAAGTTDTRRRHRLLTRPLLTAGVATGIVGAFLAGTMVTGGGGPGGAAPGIGALPRHVAFQADLEPAESCDDLLAAYIGRAAELVGPWGWGGESGHFGRASFDRDLVGSLDSARTTMSKSANEYSAPAPEGPRTERQVNSETGTNVQEAAVDEPDTVKTDGTILATVRDDSLVIYDVTGPATEKLSSTSLPGIEDAEIMLSGATIVAIGADDEATADAKTGYGYQPLRGSRVLTLSVADPANPKITHDVAYDAALASARQHGDTIRIVLSSGLPDFDFVEPKGKRGTGTAAALKANREIVAASSIEDWLPTITAGTPGTPDTAEQLLDCTDVALPTDDIGLDTTSVVGFVADRPDEVDAIGLAGATPIAYESADHLYLASRTAFDGCFRCMDMATASGGDIGSTHLFDFELDGTRATHVASGEVEGSLADRWSIDEADDILRLAVGPTSETGNFNSVVTLARQGAELVEHGRLDGLGRNEDLKSVRWFDDLAILVTFRRVDPLYAVDLTDTNKPTLLGELKIPGFSSYLHPLGRARLIGVGQGPTGSGGWGAQIGLFDVRNTADVKQIDVHHYARNTEALAGTDPRAFTWLPEHRTMLTVLQKWGGRRVGYVSVLKLAGGQLHERLVQIEYGKDVDVVRAVPMPDGRVVLVTGERADFFEL